MTTRPLRIPDRFIAGFVLMRNLSDSQAKAVTRVFGVGVASRRGSTSLRSLSEEIARDLPDFEIEDAQQLVLALASLRGELGTSDDSVEALAARIAMSTSLPAPENPADSERLAGFLARLLSAPSLILATATVDLASEAEQSFLSARTVTDIRPVFDRDATKRPLGALIMTNIRIDYYDPSGDVGSHYITLSADDLTELESVLTRAGEKIATLQTLLENAKLPYLDPNDGV